MLDTVVEKSRGVEHYTGDVDDEPCTVEICKVVFYCQKISSKKISSKKKYLLKKVSLKK